VCNADPLWGFSRWEDLTWVQWEQDYSVFDRLTGETHLLNELPAEILRRLARKPQTLDSLAEDLAGECGFRSDAAWRERIAAIVRNLETLELLHKMNA
jgi:PqqD family protein of HPr-rel-A system